MVETATTFKASAHSQKSGVLQHFYRKILKQLAPLWNPAWCLEDLIQDFEAGKKALALPEQCLLQEGGLAQLKLDVQQHLQMVLPPGEHVHLRKGHGLEFHSLREYTLQDDSRRIDWNVFARTMSPHIRQYQEENRLTGWCIVDVSPSMRYGSPVPKLEVAMLAALTLGQLFIQNRDAIGYYITTGGSTPQDCCLLPPSRQQEQLHRFISAFRRMCLINSPVHPSVTPFSALECFLKHQSSPAFISLVSDGLSYSEPWCQSLQRLFQQSPGLVALIEGEEEKWLQKWLTNPSLSFSGLALTDPENPCTLLKTNLSPVTPAQLQTALAQAEEARTQQFEKLVFPYGQICSLSTAMSRQSLLHRLLYTVSVGNNNRRKRSLR